jgi:Bacterial Ig-like domain (group 1)
MQMRSRLAPFGGLLGGLLLATVVAATAIGYAGEVAATVEASGPSGLQACNTPITITALVEDIDGKPIEGQPVTWSFLSGSVSGDTILDTETTTNASGIATTQVQFACSPRSVTIQALADDATGTMVLALSGEGLPRTDTAPASSLPAMALAALAVLIGSGTILRRFAIGRR